MPPEKRTPSVVSIGYEGRTADDLISDLRRQDVQVLVDVRLTPLSRKPGLSKTKLAAALAAAGIGYVHARSLGNPKDNRDAYRAGDQSSRQRFEEILESSAADDALSHVAELLDGGSVALLCFERDHSTCHRHQVAEALAGRAPGLRVVHV
ncbi:MULTISPECIES: DUF488 domain-containing protein [Dietzia]|uniref:DUF488 domain-containing protein n=1 Tax=Dietzia TaxID=37914 RepID=UPI0009FC6EE4|nr:MULTISPECIES: DUF488 domain-containing protein [Dietzia]MCT2059583.1 DUF488 domain-containing protein [Dietzia cinnamea]